MATLTVRPVTVSGPGKLAFPAKVLAYSARPSKERILIADSQL